MSLVFIVSLWFCMYMHMNMQHIVLVVSVRLMVSNSLSLPNKPLGIVPIVQIITGINDTFTCHNFLCSWKGLSTFMFSLIFSLLSTGTAKSTKSQVLLLNSDLVWPSDRDFGIRFYLKIPEYFVRLILYDGFWFVHLPIIGMLSLL